MAQHDMNIANQGFPAFRADINSALTAIANNSSGATEPSTTFAYQWWYDTSTNKLMMRNADNDAWIEIGTFNQTTDSFTPSGVTTDTISEGNSSVAVVDSGTGYVAVTVDGVETARFTSSGYLGVGTTSPSKKLHIFSTSPAVRVQNSDNNYAFDVEVSGTTGQIKTSAEMAFYPGGSEAMRIDSLGNVGIGTSTPGNSSWGSTAGTQLRKAGYALHTVNNDTVQYLNRLTSDGVILNLNKDGATVGSIGSDGGGIVVGGYSGSQSALRFVSNSVAPAAVSGGSRDNIIDLGYASDRFDDVYATNGTIQTSDANEKQDIAELTAEEMAVAKRVSALFKTFRWIDSVEEKGDDARVHSGVIAQDVEAAFAAEGLDAGKYALFISTTWWEKEVTVPAVEGKEAVYDEEGNLVEEAVEAKDAYVRIDEAEEGEEGAVERNRKGIRYPQLLSFLAAYNEQRFASIEDRLNALESA